MNAIQWDYEEPEVKRFYEREANGVVEGGAHHSDFYEAVPDLI